MASSLSFADTISHSGLEVDFEYETEFRSLVMAGDGHEIAEGDANASEEAQFHAAHVFGLFHSPEYAGEFGYNINFVEGFAGTKRPLVDKAEFFEKIGDPHVWVRYKATGTMVILKRVAEAWLKGRDEAHVTLPLLRDLSAIYTEDLDYKDPDWAICTDAYYQSPADFSYFYNPFRCPELKQGPVAQDVTFTVRKVKNEGDHEFPLKKLNANNGNGPLTVLYFVHGFDKLYSAGSSAHKIRSDVGYRVFNSVGRTLVEKHGFTAVRGISDWREAMGDYRRHMNVSEPIWLEHHSNRTYYRTYFKKSKGRIYVARMALLTSEAEDSRGRPLKSFAKFWKEAWENADFLYYGGHSGDGASLDVDDIDERLQHFSRATDLQTLNESDIGEIQFSKSKTQIAFIDACSSYDLYADMYRERKPRGLHLVTYGVVSLFHNAITTIEQMLDLIMPNDEKAMTWREALKSIEARQLSSQIDFLYTDKAVRTRMRNKYSEREEYPSYLLNVSVP